MKKIIACIPLSWPYVPTPFLESVVGMVGYANGKYKLEPLIRSHCYLHTMRENLAEEALFDGADYLLWLDADQSYPIDTPERLMKHEKFIVGGMTPRKDDGGSLAYDFSGEDVGIRRVNLVPGNGLQKVDAMGFGGILTDVKLFSRLREPYFLPDWNDGQTRLGEDVTFFKKCKDAGIDVWCDTGLLYEHIVQDVVRVKG